MHNHIPNKALYRPRELSSWISEELQQPGLVVIIGARAPTLQMECYDLIPRCCTPIGKIENVGDTGIDQTARLPVSKETSQVGKAVGNDLHDWIPTEAAPSAIVHLPYPALVVGWGRNRVSSIAFCCKAAA